jgi:hypothetical protein
MLHMLPSSTPLSGSEAAPKPVLQSCLASCSTATHAIHKSAAHAIASRPTSSLLSFLTPPPPPLLPPHHPPLPANKYTAPNSGVLGSGKNWVYIGLTTLALQPDGRFVNIIKRRLGRALHGP